MVTAFFDKHRGIRARGDGPCVLSVGGSRKNGLRGGSIHTRSFSVKSVVPIDLTTPKARRPRRCGTPRHQLNYKVALKAFGVAPASLRNAVVK